MSIGTTTANAKKIKILNFINMPASKKIILIFIILFSLKAAGQNNNYLISSEGIGAIKIDMTQDELGKLLGKKIPLTNPTDTISGSWVDSARINYKGMNLNLQFQRTYNAENDFYMRIVQIQTRSPLCKTKAGIGIGSGKQAIIDAYPNEILIMQQDFEEDGSIKKGKLKYIIKVRGFDDRSLFVFHLVNQKVVLIEVDTYYNDSE